MSDPNFSDVSLLLHMDGANGSTTFTDSSSNALTVTANGNAQISTAQSKWGGASGYFDGSGDYLTVPYNSDLDFGTGDFTVEFWVLFSSAGNFGFFSGASNGSFDFALFGGQLRIGRINTAWDSIFGSWSPSTGIWYHVAFTRESGTVRAFIDGNQSGSSLSDTTNYNLIGGNNAIVGASGTANRFLNGYLDDLRITKGFARYTANFTPPTGPFPDSAGGVESYFSSAGPLGDFASIGNVNPAIFSQIAGPLGQVQAVAALRALAYAEIGSPLASPAALAALRALAYGSADSPLGALAAFGSIPAAAWASSPGPLDYAALALFTRQQAALAAIPGPLGVPSPRLLHDFTGLLGDATIYYVMDLIGGASAVRAPISSWQATLQTGRSNYVQCVVPAVGAFVDAINAASEFVIYRRVVAPGVGVVEYEMARAPVQTATFDQGPARYTCTISGYSSGFAPDEDPSSAYDRTLQNIRSVSISQSGVRVRCSIDWLLRPAMRVTAGARTFIVAYINYYVGNNDAYMDVGERA